jgi:C4-dicarboxylate transporter
MYGVFEEIKKQTLTLITAALGFVAALIWKDAISAWLAPLYESAEGAMGLTIAAIVVTVIAVIVTIILSKFLVPKESKKKK